MPTDMRVNFRQLVNDGDLSFGQVRDGEVIDRDWSVWCNDFNMSDIQSFLNNGGLEADTIARYFDSQLLLGDGTVVAGADSWNPVLHPDTKEYRQGGTTQRLKLYMGFGLSITFHTVLINDSVLFAAVMADLVNGTHLYDLQLQVVYKGR